jgi:hypothetical protein
MTRGGFHEDILDYICSPGYTWPVIESGSEFLRFYAENPAKVLEEGLSLYIFSKENGRGKTTLAHYLVYVLLWHLSHTENYNPHRTYAFRNAHMLFAKRKKFEEEEVPPWESSIFVIDDLGIETKNAAWERESNISRLHQIMHHRLDNKLPTIITSNYPPSTLSSFYSGVLDSVLEIRPDGVIGGKKFRQVEVGGAEDFRLMTNTGGWPV